MDTDTLTLIHFNDVYDIDSQAKEPIGGAARFATAVKSFDHLNPVVLFSGDCFSPSLLSSVTKGEQMVPVLNAVKTKCALFGNHEFDFGVDILADLVEKTNFPWLMSNVIDTETDRPLGDGLISHTFVQNNKKIGLMGLVEWEWLETLSTIDPEAVTFRDYVEVGNELAKQLRSDGCDIVIALTHMRFPNDVRFAENAIGVDIILGGHDHVYELKHVKGIPVLKSGTDFRDFSVITVKWPAKGGKDQKPSFSIDRVSVTSDYVEDPALKEELDKYGKMMTTKMDDVLGEFAVDLDGRFSSVRTSETNLGNFLCDIMVATTNAECALLNSGTIRSDRVHDAGPFTRRDLMTILPFLDHLVVLNVLGSQLIEALENSVSHYPSLEGRFPQVSGIRFAFDPSKPTGNRIDPKFVIVGDEYIQVHQFYRLVTKKFISTGHDGYTILANAEVLLDQEACLELSIAVQNHFHAIEMVSKQGQGRRNSRHHQSLVTVSRRHSLFRSLSSAGIHDVSLSPHLEHGLSLSPRPSLARQGNVVGDLEKMSCKLRPSVEGRIVVVSNKEILHDLIHQRKEWEANRTIQEEDENSGPTSPTVLLSRLLAIHTASLAGNSSNDSDFSNSRDCSPIEPK